MYLIISRIAESDTAELECAKRLETRYIMFSVYCGSEGI